ncbi:putative disease resistance protein At3g14460 isoform X2 [Carya illinoinensis]|uniref:putative disease resistance protein At3g14460 isoform X2 n=1 Tax=Carya illinoinensis TaxID=32201 RepID=UPI001C71A708|nr:putative disease resistance protein At3g14460 isoform X2 [Carya illinoinensis]
MHDLINDLAQSVAGDTCFRMEDRVGGPRNGDISKKARHSSYLGSKFDVTKKFKVFPKLTSLRTFLPLMLPHFGECYLTHHVPLELVPTLRYLRVLSFNGYWMTKLSDSIGDLKHLRYFDLSKTKIRNLPESITSLYNLQTLLLKDCTRLKKLPLMFRNLVNLRHLNIEGANSLEGMPMQIAKLTSLQTLSNLILGKDNCSGVKELGPLKHLKGTLRISRLENVIEPKDAKDAKLIEKTNITALSLEWSEDIEESKDRTSEREILNGLRPDNDLEELVIRCTALPPFGQLPSLKILLIMGLSSVKNVGPEFCGDGTLQSFKSLETLSFKNMKELEYWSPCEELPKLRELSLIRCPKLLGKLPNILPLLNKVEINDCGQLVVSVSSFPNQCKIVLDRNEGVVCRNKVTFKSIGSDSVQTISELTCRIEGFDVEGLAKLEILSIERWEEVKHLWSDDVGSLPQLPFLRVLSIQKCDKLVSLVAEDQVEEGLQLGIPSTLQTILIGECESLKSLPKAMMYNSTCLAYISISGCDSLTHFARGQLPPTLKTLRISRCKNMRKLVEEKDDDDTNSSCSSIPSLFDKLEIDNCRSLESLTSSGELPATLRVLSIYNCPKLESVAKNFHHNSYLESISVFWCENLKFLNEGGFLPSNLRKLDILYCKKILALPNSIFNLTSLEILYIQNCPGILSFPVEGLPTNLTILEISNLKITEALFDWGLHNLTFLNQLEIGGCQHLVSFPEMTLPASLTNLIISDCSNLECLSSEGLRELASLKRLSIFDCEKLASLPEDGLPPSLLELRIYNCQKLRAFPKNGLPPSLQRLHINKCRLLEEHCKKDQRGEWRKIADIPCVEINHKYIYDTETEE